MPYSSNPLLEKLPYEGYQTNETVIALCASVDKDYSDLATLLQSMTANLTPSTAPNSYLDYLAYLVGFSGAYWDNSWSVGVKRAFITEAHSLWRNKGTEATIRKVLGFHAIQYDMWMQTNLTIPFVIPGLFSKKSLKYYIRLPITYARVSTQWREAERTIKNFSPTVVESKVCYNAFILGYSVLGEPVFY